MTERTTHARARTQGFATSMSTHKDTYAIQQGTRKPRGHVTSDFPNKRWVCTIRAKMGKENSINTFKTSAESKKGGLVLDTEVRAFTLRLSVGVTRAISSGVLRA